MVCGSSKGIGRAVAEELAKLGATITLMARNEERLAAVAEQLATPRSQNHHYLVADVSQPEQIKAIVQELTQQKPIHILINNTGGPPGGLIHEAGEAEFLQAFNNHLICNHILTKAVLGGMKAASYGRIINIISTSVKQPIDGLGVSNTTRGAVANWAKTMANELAEFGITVNNVLPGMTSTQRLDSIIQNWADKRGLTKEAMTTQLKNTIPARRFADAHEVGTAAAFLATPAAAYITGINLPVDGGRTKSL